MVASPAPHAIVELRAVKLLLDHRVLVVCAGGGGVPVVVDRHGARHGVEAVVDKDHAAALLARELRADALLLLTDVATVELEFGTPRARPLRHTSVAELERHRFAAGSMQPKVDAACWFVSTTGQRAAIGSLYEAGAIARGEAGTQIEG